VTSCSQLFNIEAWLHPENGLVRNTIAGGGDNCPNCGASLAPDQRYCLACGHRRGDPRLPFMDAVVFMESAKRPVTAEAAPAAAAPAPDRRPFMSANASLVAGVATLILAIGVGVLIGRSGDGGSSNAAAPAPQVITVPAGGSAAPESTGKKENAGAGSKGASEPKSKAATKKKAQKKLQTTSHGTTEAVNEVYEPKKGIKIAPPTQKIGGECEPGVAGCSKNGKFEGTFFE
jgi:zinc-ribbon domain